MQIDKVAVRNETENGGISRFAPDSYKNKKKCVINLLKFKMAELVHFRRWKKKYNHSGLMKSSIKIKKLVKVGWKR